MENNYFLGIDPGTDSTGFAVTDSNFNLIKINGENAWGVRLFDEASSAKERRALRSNRRRMARRRYRIYLLNNFIFGKEIERVDKTFLLRLNETNLFLEDKSELNQTKYPLFVDKNIEKEFFKKYPTIYHLRKAQIQNNPEAFTDIRYLYLSVHHIIKKRGNFLTEGDYNPDSPITEEVINSANDGVSQYIHNLFDDEINDTINLFNEANLKEIADIILDAKSDLNTRDKKAKIKEILLTNIDQALYKELKKEINELLELFINTVLCGNKKINDIEINFNSNYEEKRPEFEGAVGELITVLDLSNSLFNSCYIKKSLGEEKYFSFAMVKAYEKHRKDLKLLKKIAKALGEDVYNDMFKKEYNEKDKNKEKNAIPSYSLFINSSSKYEFDNSKGYQAFKNHLFKYLSEILENPKYKDNLKLVGEIKEVLFDLENNNFLKRPRDINSSTFPHQFHEKELDIILKNASNYFSFLNENDNIEKIKSTFLYKLNYFDGPLNTQSIYSNIVKKGNPKERVYPWNKSEIVDERKTNENFVSKLISECTYFKGEKVLPKFSILYNDFIILNQLNSLVINGNKITKEVKLSLFNFIKNRNKTTIKQLKDYLINHYEFYKKDGVSLSKIDLLSEKGFVSPTRPILKDVFDLDDPKVVEEIDEKIIKTLTIYSEDKKSALKIIRGEMNLTKSQDIAIKKLSCKDWARLSKKFLTYKFADENGVITKSIIEYLNDETLNLQEILYLPKLNINNQINEINARFAEKMTKREQIDSLINSAPPMMRRPVIQAFKIAYEIKKHLKTAPSKIMIESTRTNNAKKERTKSRKLLIQDFLKPLLKDADELFKKQAEKLNKELEEVVDEMQLKGEALYLYFSQLGLDLYTGLPIALEDILTSDKYDVDHIIPQSLIKNDSLDNKVLVNKDANEKEKSNIYPLPISFVSKNMALWKRLLDKKAISETKYNNLIRRKPLTEDELNEFINRQINVVNHSNILLRDVFALAFPESKIIFQKSENVSFLRNEYGLVKVRELNDTHHAVDAYFNIVTGQLLDKYYAKYNLFNKNNDKNVTYNPETVIKNYFKLNPEKLELMKKVYLQQDMLITVREKYSDGKFYDQNIKGRPDRSGLNKLVAVHTKGKLRNVERYGGFNSLSRSYFVVGKNNKGKKVMISVPIMYMNIKDKKLLNEKLCEVYAGSNKNIVFDLENKIYNNSIITFEGAEKREKYILSLKSAEKCALTPLIPLFLNEEQSKYLKTIIKMKDFIAEKSGGDSSIEQVLINRNRKGKEFDVVSKGENLKLMNKILDELKEPKWNFAKSKTFMSIITDRFLNEDFSNLNLINQIENLIESMKIFNREKGVFYVGMDALMKMNPILLKYSPTGLIVKRIKL